MWRISQVLSFFGGPEPCPDPPPDEPDLKLLNVPGYEFASNGDPDAGTKPASNTKRGRVFW